MSTNTFFQAFNRITSRRGLCGTIWSDNAKYADREIRNLYKSQLSDSNQPWSDIDQAELLAKLVSKGMKWKFIVEHFPARRWRERFIGNVKEPLRKVVGRALLSCAKFNNSPYQN